MVKTINFEKKKMISLTNEHEQPYEKAKICCICKNIVELEIIAIIQLNT